MPIGAPQAPRDKGAPRKPTAKTIGQSSITEARQEGLEGIAQLATAGLILTNNLADAGAVDMHAAPIAHEIAILAENDEKIANVVDRITSLGPYAALLAAVMPLGLQIMVNHGRINATAAGLMGGKVMSKEALESKVQADLDIAKARFMREAAEAREEAERAQEELRRAAA